VTSTISGVLGMAGGIALLGVMTAVLPARLVVPLHGLVQLVSNFTRTLVYLKHVHWRLFAIYTLPAAVGATCAALLWSGTEIPAFRGGIGVFILVFLWWRRRAPKLRALPYWTYAPLGAVTGFVAVFVGATGPFVAPFFFRDDLEKEQIIATKAVCQAFVHFMKIPAFLAVGFDYLSHATLSGVLIVCVVLGTLAGRWVLTRISRKTFVRVFETVLIGVALYLIGREIADWLPPSGSHG
jgi:uncharacterized membrane protein YfcA